MRKDFGVKPWVLPQPVLIIGTYDKDDKDHIQIILGFGAAEGFKCRL